MKRILFIMLALLVSVEAFARMFSDVAVIVPDVASAVKRGIMHRIMLSTIITCHFLMFPMLTAPFRYESE